MIPVAADSRRHAPNPPWPAIDVQARSGGTPQPTNQTLRQQLRRRGALRSVKGQALVEFALIVPLLLLLILIIIDFGRAFYIQTALQNGAREGARFGTIHPTWVISTSNADPINPSPGTPTLIQLIR